jgi:hypothetical protein
MKLSPTTPGLLRAPRHQPSKLYTFMILGALATGLGVWIVARKVVNLLLT